MCELSSAADASRKDAPEWITAFTAAYERVSGGLYRHGRWPIDPGPKGPETPLWGSLSPRAQSELEAWWAWIATRPIPAGELPRTPSTDLALDRDTAAKFALRIWNWTSPDDDVWRAPWVPIAGEQDAVAYLDTSDERLPVYLYWTFGGSDPKPVAYGVSGYIAAHTALLEAGCYVFDDHPYRPGFLLNDAPLPTGFDSEHPLMRGIVHVP